MKKFLSLMLLFGFMLSVFACGANENHSTEGYTDPTLSDTSFSDDDMTDTQPDSGDDQTETDSGDDQTETNGGDDQTETDGGDDQTETDSGDDQTETDSGDDQTETDGGDDQTETDSGDDQTETDSGDDQTETDSGDDQTETDGGDDQTETDGGDDQTKPDGAFEPILRFAVTSDIHITAAGDNNAIKTADMIRQMNEFALSGADGYNKLDAFVIAGDLTNNGALSEYNAVKKILDDSISNDTKLVITTGNHDWNTFKSATIDNFESVFGEGCCMRDTVINGYHFITIVGDASNGWEYSQAVCQKAEELIKAAIADTGEDKPIFIIQHIGNVDTAVGTCTAADQRDNTASSVLTNMQSKYSNLVVFSGHSHFAANDECSIHQKDFTSINTGTLNYAMSSKINSSAISMQDRYKIAQNWVVEIDAYSRMRVRCWDSLQEKFVGDTWLVESWNKEDFVYTEDRFSNEDLFFSSDAEVTVKNILSSSASVSFPPVSKDSLSGRVYEITVKGSDGNIHSVIYKGVEFFNENFDNNIEVNIGNLEPDTRYTVEVRAVNSLYTVEISADGTLYSDPLTADFTTAAETVKSGADLIDITINSKDNTVSNSVQSGLAPVASGTVTTVYDPTIDMDVVKFDGTSSSTVKFVNYSYIANEMKDSMTFEAYFKIDAIPTGKYFSIISAQQGGGFGFDVYGNSSEVAEHRKNQCVFHYHDGSYKSIGFTYEVDVYYHLVAVYDGSNYKLYVNGELIGTETMGSSLVFPADSAKNIYLGGDTNKSGNCENPSKCTVAEFRLYSYALTENEVTEAYTALKG